MTEIPDEVDQILQTLPPRTGFYIPDDILELWFPPGASAGLINDGAKKTAEDYGARFNCRFWYFPDRKEGCFAKNPKAP